MKKLIKAAFIVCLLLLSAGFAYAADEVGISIDGTQVEFTQESGQPFIDENNRTQVPFRQTLEAFGATVNWDPDSRTAIAEKDGVIVNVPIGADYIYKGDLQVMNDTKSLIKDGRTYLPIRIVLEAFGADVSFDAQSRTVLVKSDGETLSLSILAAEVNAAMEAVKSMDAEMTMDIKMEIAGEKIDMTSAMKMSMFYDPLKIKIINETSAAGVSAKVETYLTQKGDNLTAYVSIDGADYVKALEMNADEYDDMIKNESLANMLPKFENKGMETVGGVSTVKLEGVISKEMMEEVFSSLDFSSLLSGTEGAENFELAAADIPMTIWIDTQSKIIVKYSIDIAEYLLATLQAMPGAEDAKVNAANAEVMISNINKAAEFTLPEKLPE